MPRAAKSSAIPAAIQQREWPFGWHLAALLIAALLAYSPALHGTLLWDDAGHVTRPDLRSLAGLGRIWFEIGATQQYYPILHSAFWLEHHLWGDAVLGYHLINVALHALTAGLFGLLLRQFFKPAEGHERRYAGVEWLAAWLFLLHPVCVESVAWISEQKNTLSAVFYLGAALAWLRFERERTAKVYALATGLFLLALLTKTVTATLPAALLVVGWWQRGRLDWRRDVLPLLPWFALGIATGLFTAHFEKTIIGASGADFTLSALDRVVLAGRVFWFYLGHLAWPAELLFIYPRWTVDAGVWWQWLFPVAGLVLLGGLLAWSRRSRAPLAVALLFGGTLFPALGFVNVYPFIFSYVADHFQYLASLACFALLAAGLVSLTTRWSARVRMLGAALLLATLGTLSWRQSAMYRDVFVLYETTLARNPDVWMAHQNLALALMDAGRLDESLPHLEAALRLHPNYAPAENNLGNNLVRRGRAAEALPHLEKALQLQPNYPAAHNNLGSALLALDRLPESLAQFEKATQLDPRYALAHRNLGIVLAMSERIPEAITHFAEAVRIDPNYADAELNWAVGLMVTRNFAEAEPHFARAVDLDPDSVDIRNTYGRALLEHRRFNDALIQFEAAFPFDPDQAGAHMNLALTLRELGRLDEAGRHYTEALRLNPALGRQR